jgi:serine phosphatase RsbU (regulator of sigma subunit)
VLAAELRRMLDATEVSLLIADFSGDALMRLVHVGPEVAVGRSGPGKVDSVSLPGTVFEQVLWSQELSVTGRDGDWQLLVPVTERGDAIGLLELTLPRHPDAETVEYLESAALALAYVLVATRRHTDLYEWAQRDTPFSLAAEIQRRLLPSSYTLEGGAFTLAGWLEPAAQVGGDSFDYSLDRTYLYASISDAMGHSNDAALLASLVVGSLRNTRRSMASPVEQSTAANAAVLAGAHADQFVTAQVLRIRLADGLVELVNAGHPAPYLLRDGNAAELDVEVGPAFGLVEHGYEGEHLQLQPGDRLMLVTDGFLERRAVRLDLAEILVRTADRHPREVVRELATNVLRVTEGRLLDDATVLCIDWYGPDAARTAIGGASRGRATGRTS